MIKEIRPHNRYVTDFFFYFIFGLGFFWTAASRYTFVWNPFHQCESRHGISPVFPYIIEKGLS